MKDKEKLDFIPRVIIKYWQFLSKIMNNWVICYNGKSKKKNLSQTFVIFLKYYKIKIEKPSLYTIRNFLQTKMYCFHIGDFLIKLDPVHCSITRWCYGCWAFSPNEIFSCVNSVSDSSFFRFVEYRHCILNNYSAQA